MVDAIKTIADDNLKDKKGRRGDGEGTITSSMLTEIIHKSMRVFWEFLRADKDEAYVTLKGPELQDSIDSELLIEIRTDFQKVCFYICLRTNSILVKSGLSD